VTAVVCAQDDGTLLGDDDEARRIELILHLCERGQFYLRLQVWCVCVCVCVMTTH
jgi:hypothetical protein